MKQHDFLPGGQLKLPRRCGGAFWAFLLVAAIAPAGASGAIAAESPENPALNSQAPSEIEERLGIKTEGLRRSAAGYMLDFRYRLNDSAKASPLLDRKIRPYLLDEASGAQMGVPDAPKVGQLRPTSRNKVIPGRNYYILFANPGRYLQAGSKVTLIAGDTRIPHLTIE